MFTPTNHGFSADLMKTVRDILEEGVPKTSAGATEAKVVQAVGQIKHFAKEMYKGDIKKAYKDWAAKTTFGPALKADVLKRAGGVNEATDPVDKKELTKSFEKRKDKDIDNDGDTDSSDEYLHKRRKAISKAMKEETDVDEGFINLGGAKVKDDEKSILQHIKKTFPNVKKVKKDSQHGWIPVFEEVDLEEGKKWKSMVQWEDAAKKLGYTVKKQGGYGPIWVAFDHKNNRVAGKYNLEDPSTATLQ